MCQRARIRRALKSLLYYLYKKYDTAVIPDNAYSNIFRRCSVTRTRARSPTNLISFFIRLRRTPTHGFQPVRLTSFIVLFQFFFIPLWRDLRTSIPCHENVYHLIRYGTRLSTIYKLLPHFTSYKHYALLNVSQRQKYTVSTSQCYIFTFLLFIQKHCVLEVSNVVILYNLMFTSNA